jgi:tetratricopeptide (TPR) repeat protein
MLLQSRQNINSQALEFFSRGNFKKRAKNYKDALLDFDKAIELYPLFADAFFKRGNIKNLLGDNDGAIQDYNKAIELNPNLAEAYHNRGLTKLRSGDEQSGNLDFLKAGMLGYMRAYDVNKEFCN